MICVYSMHSHKHKTVLSTCNCSSLINHVWVGLSLCQCVPACPPSTTPSSPTPTVCQLLQHMQQGHPPWGQETCHSSLIYWPELEGFQRERERERESTACCKVHKLLSLAADPYFPPAPSPACFSVFLKTHRELYTVSLHKNVSLHNQ